MSRTSVGARAQVMFEPEGKWGNEPNSISKTLDITSEGISSEIGALASNSLRPDRATHKRVRGTFNVTGALNYEQNPSGNIGTLYKHALGTALTCQYVDGGIRAIVSSDAASDATIINVISIPSAFPASGKLTAVVKNASTGSLTAVEGKTFDSRSLGDSTFAMATGGFGTALAKGTRLFLYDANYSNVYTHVIDAFRTLPEGMTVEVGRDAAYFTYSGCKVNTLNETYSPSDILAGSIDFLGKDEFWGSLIALAVSASDSTVTIDDASRFDIEGNTVGIGTEDGITYTSVSGGTLIDDNSTGTLSLTVDSQIVTCSGATWLTGASPVRVGDFLMIRQADDANNYGIWKVKTIDSNTQVTLEDTMKATAAALSAWEVRRDPDELRGVSGIGTAHAVNEAIFLQDGATAVYPPADPLTGFQAGFYLNDIGSAIAEQEVLSCNFTINNNLFADKFMLGRRFRSMLPEQRRTVEGSLSVEFDDMQLYKRFTEDVPAWVEIRAISHMLVDTAQDVYYQKHIVLPNCEYNGSTPNASGFDIITHDLPFTSLWSDTYNLPEISIILVNEQSSI